MPIEDGVVIKRGERGEIIRIPLTLTRLQIGNPNLEECIVVEDTEGIEIDRDPQTGMIIFHAKYMTVASEGKK